TAGERTVEVDAHRLSEQFVGNPLGHDTGLGRHPGVVDEDVDGAEAVEGGVDHRPDAVGRGNVALDGERGPGGAACLDLLGRLIELLLPPGGQHHVGTGAGEDVCEAHAK